MRQRQQGLVRAWLAAGLFVFGGMWALSFARADDAQAPAPPTETMRILDAQKSGDLSVVVRGQGTDRVKFTLKNTSNRRLNIVLPPGLVAAASSGQGAGGFQSMGLGVPTANLGRFGQFRDRVTLGAPNTADAGFRMLPPAAPAPEALGISSGQTLELLVPSVCLNFGLPNPTPKNTFKLVDVDDYSPDPRVRKALRSLATLGTSQGVAQAVMWHVANGMSFEQITAQAAKYVNTHEISVAARFVEALDASGDSELVDAAYFTQGRILVRVLGDGSLAKVAHRLGQELEGAKLFGLPVEVVADVNDHSRPSSLLLNVTLTSSKDSRLLAKTVVRHCSAVNGWNRIGQVDTIDLGDATLVKGSELASALDTNVAKAFVTATAAKRSPGITSVRVVNRLPFTVSNVIVRTGKSSDGNTFTFETLGVGPMRTAMTQLEAPGCAVERIELNGL